MAKNRGFISGITGRLGNTTSGYYRGAYITRVLAEKVSNPRTRRQETVRARFKALTQLASAFMPIFDNSGAHGLTQYSRHKRHSEFNCFTHLNWDMVSASNPFDVEVSYADLIVGKGKLPQVSFAAPSFEETNSIQCAFIGNNDEPGADSSDSVYLFAYSPELGKGLLSAPVSRSEQSITLNTPLGWNGTTVHVYGVTVSGSNVASDGAYVGSGTIN